MSQSTSRTFKNAAYAQLAEIGKALSSPARLEILELLAQAPRTVETLAGEVEQSVANTSHHLQVLKRANIVKTERDGLHIIYSLAGADVAGLLVQLQAVAAEHLAALDKLTREFFENRDGLEAIDRDTLLERLNSEDAVLIDVRPAREYEQAHLPGALTVPLADLKSRLGDLPRDRTIIAYCRGPFCTLSADAVSQLRELGFDAQRSDLSVHDFEWDGDMP